MNGELSALWNLRHALISSYCTYLQESTSRTSTTDFHDKISDAIGLVGAEGTKIIMALNEDEIGAIKANPPMWRDGWIQSAIHCRKLAMNPEPTSLFG
jgi:hypothetical protein